MAILISYDVSDKNAEFKNILMGKGYEASFTLAGVPKPLPESTLIKTNGTERAAINDMRTAAQQLQIELERAVAVSMAGIELFP